MAARLIADRLKGVFFAARNERRLARIQQMFLALDPNAAGPRQDPLQIFVLQCH